MADLQTAWGMMDEKDTFDKASNCKSDSKHQNDDEDDIEDIMNMYGGPSISSLSKSLPNNIASTAFPGLPIGPQPHTLRISRAEADNNQQRKKKPALDFPKHALNNNSSPNATISIPPLLPTQDSFLGYEDPHSYESRPALIVPACAAQGPGVGPGETCGMSKPVSPAPPVPPYAAELEDEMKRQAYKKERQKLKEQRRAERARKLAEELKRAEQYRDDYGMCFRPNNLREGSLPSSTSRSLRHLQQDDQEDEKEEDENDEDVDDTDGDKLDDDIDASIYHKKKAETRKQEQEQVFPYVSMPYSNIVEIALYIITGIMLIFVLEQFIQIGVRIGAASAFSSGRGF